MSHDHSHHDHSHEHGHVHDITEVIESATEPEERGKLFRAGIANGVLAVAGTWVEAKTGAQPSLAEAVHNVGDVSFYLTPWAATMYNGIESNRALKWMRISSSGVAAIALGGSVREVYTLANGSYEHTQAGSIGMQAGLTLGNICIALYMAHKPKKHKGNEASRETSTMKSIGIRHATVDAATSVGATLFNVLASKVNPTIGPLGAILLNGATGWGEKKNIQQVNKKLSTD